MSGGADASGRVQTVTVDENSEGQRLDNFLIARLRGVPRSWVYRVLRRGEVRVNKGRCKPARRLQVGDVVRIPPLRTADRPAHAVSIVQIEKTLKTIIYEDDLLLIVNKPAGLAVHGGSGLSHGLIEILRAARPHEGFLELAHRLDRETSGCLMLAKKRSALRRLQELQRAGEVEKRYLTLLQGRSRKGTWRIDLPLKKNTLKSGERIVRVDPAGKPAATVFRVQQRFNGSMLVEATLETGRTHQIRVHAAANGTPILGDPKYGDAQANRQFRTLGLRRLFLHAASLRFAWPSTKDVFQIQAPLPTELQSVVDTLQADEQDI